MKRSWRRWFQGLLAGGGRPKAKDRNRAHLMLEGLEDRTLLSTATHFAIVGLPNPIPVGTAVTFTVEALDANNSIDTGYDGTTHLTSTDSKAVLPAGAPLTSGVGTFSATLGTIGSQSIAVTGPPYDGPTFVNAPGSPISVINAFAFAMGGYLSGGNTFDLVEASGYTGAFAVLLGNGNGTFSPGPSESSGEGSGEGPNWATIGDFRGDGINDLAFVDNNDYITVCLGNGNGTFGPPATYDVGSEPKAIVAGSFNGSSQEDLAVLNTGNNTITILMANPQGSFGTTFLVPTTTLTVDGAALPTGQVGQLAVGHFTNDGNLDLAVVNTNSNDVEVFLGNGNGTFQAGRTFAAGPSPSALATGDLNNNGIDDIVINNPSAGTVSVLMANGNGTFQSPASFGAGPSPVEPTIADVNGDGIPDIVENDSNQNEVAILLGNGNGTFRLAPFLASQNNGGYAVIVGDLTGQGLPDIVDGSINVYLNQPLTGTTTVVDGPGPASHFTVSASSTAVVGKPAAFTVTAFDQFNDATTDYSGTLSFTSSDPAASFPANATLTNGVGLFSVTFATRGNQTITVGDSVLSSLTGSSASILVSGPATHFTVQAPAGATAGIGLSVTVTAFDSSNNLATGYTGTVHFASSDSQAVLPPNSTLAGGLGIFTLALKTAGSQTLTAADSVAASITASTTSIAVSPGPAAHFALSGIPANITAGAPITFAIVVRDQFNNTVTGYTGTVHFGSTDTQAALPLNAPLSSGTGVFTTTLKTVGLQAISATDTVASTLSGVSTAITVASAAATHFSVSAPATTAAGSVFVFTVTAFDQFNNVATSYGGTVHFSSSDSQAVLPANATLTNGMGTFGVTFKTAGNQTLTATDAVTASITGTGNAVFVVGPVSHFHVSAPASTTAGSALGFTVTALDSLNDTVTGYSGTVSFSSSDSQAVLPANATLLSGVGIFSATLGTAGRQSLTVTDSASASISGISGPVTVSPLAFSHLAMVGVPVPITSGTPFNFTVEALDPFNNVATSYNSPVHFVSSDSIAALPPNSALVSGVGSFTATLKTAGSQTVTIVSLAGGSGTLVPAPGSPINVGSGMVTLAVGDFNADGRLDVAAATDVGGTVKILLGNGDGTFQSGPTYTVGFNDQGMVTGDFNGDGKLDLALTVYDSGIIEVMMGNGNGTFGPPVTYPVGTNPCALVTGDFNHDGKLDLAVANIGSNTISVLLGNGNGTFQAAVNYAVASEPTRLALGDFNGDGNLDIVAGDQGSNAVSVLLSNGNGTFLPAANYAAGTGAFGPAVGDFTGNGKQDLAVADYGGSAISILLGNGNGTFGPPTSIAVGSGPDFVVTGDINGDGIADLVVANRNSNSVSILLGNGNGTFSFGQTLAVNSSPRQVALADLTGDGAPDLVVANEANNGVDIFLNQAVATTVPVTVIPAAASHFTVSAPSQTLLGGALRVTVTALDPFNNIATGYAGTVNFSSSDRAAVLPAGGTLVSGVGTFSLTLVTQGNQTLTVADSLSSTVTGTSAAITVSGAATHFSVGSGSSATAGSSMTITVTALDSLGNIAFGYSGTVHFASTDSQAGLPANATLTAGVGTFTLTLKTAGSQTLTASDSVVGSIAGSSSPIVVSPGPTAHFALSGIPANASAGTPITFAVVAEDQFNNMAPGYTGTIHFASTDSQAALPGNAALNSGTGFFTATLKTAGSQTLTASDTVNPAINGISTAINVVPSTAARFSLGAPSTLPAGNLFVVTVTAFDAFNNVATGYGGVVHFTSSDSLAVLPANGTLAAGVGLFGAALKTAGTERLTAADTMTNSFAGTTAINITAAAAAHFAVSAPTAPITDNTFVFTVTALDAFNNTATSYAGTVHFTSSDSLASLPANAPLTSGIGIFAAILATVGNQTLTATDTVNSSIAGVSNSINVTIIPLAPTHFVISAANTATVGDALIVTVTAEDQFNNVASAYTGTVHFASSDSQAVLPPDTTLAAGTGIFSIILRTAGSQTLTVTDTVSSSITGTLEAIVVTASGATHFAIIAPNSTTAGTPVVFQVTALDQFNHTVTGYAGTVQLTSSDSQAVLSSSTATLTNGVGFFAATLEKSGNQILSATDTVFSSISGVSNTIAVSAGAATHLGVSAATLPSYPGVLVGPTSFATTGVPLAFTVTALDSYGNIAPTYAGTVHFTSSDTAPGVVLPPNGTLSSGVATFSATLMTPGNDTITAADTSSGISGTSNAIVTRGLVVTGFTPTASGFTISFNKPFNAGTVNLYTTGSVPDDVILATTASQVSVRGSLVINASGTSFTFVKTDTAGGIGSLNPASGLLAAGNYTVTLRSSNGTNGFQDSLGDSLDGSNSGTPGTNFQLTFAVSTPPAAVGIPDFARGPSNTDAIFFATSLTNGSTFTLSYTNPAASPNAAIATVTFSSTAATLQSNIQTALTSGGLATQIGVGPGGTPNSVVVVTNDVSSGANVLVTFQNALAEVTGQLLTSTTPGVNSSTATINIPNNIPGNGIPVALSNGKSVTSGSFTLQYNPALLTMSGVVSKIAGASFTLNNTINNATSATAVLSLSSPSPISASATAITLGALLATVPLSATANYGAKQLLHFSSEQLNGTAGPIPVTNADGIQVAAYLGDVTDTGGPFVLQDAADIAAVAGGVPNVVAQTVPGFAAFANLDPVIIGDVALQGSVNSTDAGAMIQEVAGSAKVAIPYAPIGLPITPVGPDPALSVPTNLQATSGSTLIVPVDIDTAHPFGSPGLLDAVLAMNYDPQVFDVSAADVQLGTVPTGGNGWQLETQVNAQTGQIGVELFSNTPIQSTAGGSLVTIALHVRDTAPPGNSALTLVSNVDPTGGLRVYQTQLSDGQGLLVLHQDVTAAGIEPGAPGEVSITNRSPSEDGGGLFASSAAVSSATEAVPASDLKVTALPLSQPSSASAIPLAVLEQVFEGMAEAALAAENGTYAQPGAILTSESDDRSASGVRTVGVPLLGSAPADWLSEEGVAYLCQTARRSRPAPVEEWLDGGETD